MKSNITIMRLFIIFGVILFYKSGLAGDLILEKKTLKRPMDPVLMEGTVASDVVGMPLDNLRVYAYSNGKFEPIRYQIDEMTGENGDWIFPVGVEPNGHLTNGKFDDWDVLAFIAEDTGDKIDKNAWTDGYTKGSEIEVIDPLTGEKGWVYLLYFASDPPARSSLPGYTHYIGKTHTMVTDVWNATSITTPDGRKGLAYKGMLVTKQAGGNGQNFVDRLKVRVTIKMLFSGITVRLHEETLNSGTLAVQFGPVRTNVRAESYYRIPGGYKVFRLITDSAFYRDCFISPFMVNIPFKPNTVISSGMIRFGNDFSPDIKGKAILLNSENPEGFEVDGKMDDGEKNFNPAPDKWRILSGDFGSLMTRTIVSEKYQKYGTIKMGLIDDETQATPPETYPGSIGYMYEDWIVGNLPRGTYHLFVEWCFPPRYKPGVEVSYLNTLDHPLKIRSETQEDVSQLLKAVNISHTYSKPIAKEKFSKRKGFVYDSKLGKYEERNIEDAQTQFSGMP